MEARIKHCLCNLTTYSLKVFMSEKADAIHAHIYHKGRETMRELLRRFCNDGEAFRQLEKYREKRRHHRTPSFQGILRQVFNQCKHIVIAAWVRFTPAL